MSFLKIILGFFGLIILLGLIKIFPKSLRNFKFLSLKKLLIKEIEEFNYSPFESSILKNYENAKTRKILAFGSVKGIEKIEFKSLFANNNLDKRNKWNSYHWEIANKVDDEGLKSLNKFYADLKSKIEANFDLVSANLYFDVDIELNNFFEDKVNEKIKKVLYEYSVKDNILIGGWPDGDIDPSAYKSLENINHPEVFKSLKIEKEEFIENVKNRIDDGYQPDFSQIFDKIEANINKRLSDPELERVINIGINKAFIDFKNLVGSEKVYVFGIYTSSEYNVINILGNTFEALNEAIEKQPGKNHHKWGFGDWKYSWKISNKELEKASDILSETTNYLWSECKEDENIIDYQAFEWAYDDFFYENYDTKYDDKILRIFQKATESIRRENPEIFFYYHNYDPPKEKLLNSLKKFNSNDKVKMFENEFYSD